MALLVYIRDHGDVRIVVDHVVGLVRNLDAIVKVM